MTRLSAHGLGAAAALLVAALFIAGAPARGQAATCNDHQECHVLLGKILTVLKSVVQTGSTPNADAIKAWYHLKQLYAQVLDGVPPDLKNSLVEDRQLIDTVLKSQSVSIRRAERDAAQQRLLQQGEEVAKQTTPGSPSQDAELAGLYIYYMTLQVCAERFPLVFKEPMSGFRDVLKDREKNLPKEHTDLVWNATAERFRLAETKFTVEVDSEAIQDCEQMRRQVNSLLASVPNAAGDVPLRQKDF